MNIQEIKNKLFDTKTDIPIIELKHGKTKLRLEMVEAKSWFNRLKLNCFLIICRLKSKLKIQNHFMSLDLKECNNFESIIEFHRVPKIVDKLNVSLLKRYEIEISYYYNKNTIHVLDLCNIFKITGVEHMKLDKNEFTFTYINYISAIPCDAVMYVELN